MLAFPLHFQDLEFKHTFVPWRTADGQPTRRWVPYGMPRLRQRVLKSVFYLFARNPNTNRIEGPFGSGVVVLRPAARFPGLNHAYGVTAYHVAVRKGASIIRVNRVPVANSEEPTAFIEKDPSEWHFIPDGDDLAVVDLTDDLYSDKHDIVGAPETDFVTPEFIRRVTLGPGDDAFMLGLFAPHHGGEINTPAARFGNISIMADARSPIEQANHALRPSHVFDMHSRPGFSGSPVFVYRTPGNDLTSVSQNGAWSLTATNNVFVKLLGIHSGQFLERLTVEKAKVAEGWQKDPIIEGDDLSLQSSMTIVAPAWGISELLNLPVFEERREMRERDFARKGGPKVQPETANAAPPATDENPKHREDFTSLLNSAAKKPPQGD